VCEATLGAQAPTEAQLIGSRDHADSSAGEHGQVSDVGERGSQRDHLLDIFGTALRQNLGEQPAPAVSDQSNWRAIALLDVGNSMTESGQHVLRMERIDVDP